MSQTRVRDLSTGTAMIVTDLHGDQQTYQKLRDEFLRLYAKGIAHYFILCGDLIHGYGDASEDGSVAMLLDVMRLQRELGEDTVIMLLGNHEFSHIYNVILMKGHMEYTARFEHTLVNTTDEAGYNEVFNFFLKMPFYVRTQAGVMVSHAGAAPHVVLAQQADELLTFDHSALLYLADDIFRNKYDIERIRANSEYRGKVAQFFAITDTHHPRFHHQLRGQIISQTMPEFNILWDTFFNQNENQYGQNVYDNIVETFLTAISSISPTPQNVLVMGHIPVRGGHKIVNQQLLRLATHAHANPQDKGEYLLLNCAIPIKEASELIPYLHKTHTIKNAP